MIKPTREMVLAWYAEWETAHRAGTFKEGPIFMVAELAFAAGHMTGDANADLVRAAYLLREAAFDRAEGRQLATKLESLAASLRIGATVTHADVERLRAENEALRTDAKRYRMVRRGQKWSVVNGIGDALRGPDLDAAIDTALQGSKERGDGTGQ